MVGLARAARTAEAGRVFRRYRAWLGDEVGLEPSVDLFALDAAIISGVEAARSVGGRPPARLPRRTSVLVGRDDELRRLGEAIGASGVVTLVGAGGVGKTRLALEIAHTASAAGGVWFVDLAPVSGPAGVATAMCQALDLPAGPSGAVEELERAVAGGLQGLIVVDNCEHILDAAADVVAMVLRRSTSITMLATSRQPLDVEGE